MFHYYNYSVRKVIVMLASLLNQDLLICYMYELKCVFCVQVSKTDPSPKREMPTMILFNVVFALRVSHSNHFKHVVLQCGQRHNQVRCSWVGCAARCEIKGRLCACVREIIPARGLSGSTQRFGGRRGPLLLPNHLSRQGWASAESWLPSSLLTGRS